MSLFIPYRYQTRNDTAAALYSLNEVLLVGELCVEIDTGKSKLGDGVTSWTLLPYQDDMMFAIATGTDNLVATFTSEIVLYDGFKVHIRAGGANTAAATFNPNSFGSLPLTKHGGVALVAGDIAGAGHELILVYNSIIPRWELTNPASSTAPSPSGTGFRHVTSGTEDGTARYQSDAETTFTDITTNDASTTKHGFLKKLSNISTEFMNGTGNWSTPAGGGGSGESVLIDFIQTAHGFVVGNAIYFNGTDWLLADRDVDTSMADGVVSAVADANNFTYQQSGLLTLTTGQWDAVTGDSGGLVPGEFYNLSSVTGQITNAILSTGYSQLVLKAISATDAIVMIGDAFNMSADVGVGSGDAIGYEYTQTTHGFSVGMPVYQGALLWAQTDRDSDLTPCDAIVSAIGATGSGDANYSLVTSLWHANGADLSTTLTDEKGLTWVLQANAKLNTAGGLSGHFGSNALACDGTGDYAYCSSVTSFGAGSWTQEVRLYCTSLDAGYGNVIFSNTAVSGYGLEMNFVVSGADVKLQFSASSVDGSFGIANAVQSAALMTSAAFVTGFHSVAVQFTGTAYEVYFDGVRVINVASAAICINHLGLRVGGNLTSAQCINAWLEEYRLTLGVARYTTPYTPATAAFPDTAPASNDFTVVYRGRVTLSTGQWDARTGDSGGLTKGERYWTSTVTGGLTKTQPTSGFAQCIGFAESATVMVFQSGQVFELTGESTVPAAYNPLCVWNQCDRGIDTMTLANGQRSVTGLAGAAWRSVRATTYKVGSGKWYFEIKLESGVANTCIVGIATALLKVATEYTGRDVEGFAYYFSSGEKINNNIFTAMGTLAAAGDIIGIAVDLDNLKIFFAKNNVWMNSGDPTAGTGAFFTTLSATNLYYPSCANSGVNQATLRARIADFSYTPPTEFLPWDSN